jgi:hypothetical protein
LKTFKDKAVLHPQRSSTASAVRPG